MFVTGVTGFVGEALLERLLYDFPTTHITVLVRARGGFSAEDRIRELLTKPAFGRGRTPPADCRNGSRGSCATPNASTSPAVPSPWRWTPSGAASSGWRSGSWTPGGSGHEPSAGPTATRSPRRWQNARSRRPLP